MDKELSLIQHLEELRKRIIICLLTVLISSSVSFFYTGKILDLISIPVGKMIFLKPAEAFSTRVKLSLYGGLFISLPVLLFQAWRFVSPGLIPIERRLAFILTPVSYILFAIGAAFAYFLVLPVGVKFLLSYGTETVTPLISVNNYLSFAATFILSFGLIFQLPVILLLLTKTGLVTSSWLSSKRRYAILLIFIIAAVVTPGPDVFSQVMLAGPLYLLFEISVFLCRFVTKKKDYAAG